MRFAVLGTGDVGRALAAGLQRHGHAVVLGTRDPTSTKLDDWRGQHPGIEVAAFADAAAGAEALVLAVNWGGAKPVCEAIAPHAAGKVLIDATNPLAFSGEGPPTLAVCGDDSAGESVQRWVPGARVVKCWNIVGNPFMIDPVFEDGAPTMFVAGQDPDAKRSVQELLASVGWGDCVDLGGIEASRYLEGLAMVWILAYFATGSGAHAFRLLRR